MTLSNLRVVALQQSFIGIAAMGTAVLIISGNIDLSIGSIFGLCAVAAAMLAREFAAPIAILAAVVLGGLLGWFNGLLVWRIKISPIIVTLGSMAVLRGVVLLATGGFGVRGVPKEFKSFCQIELVGVAMPVFILISLALVAHLMLSQTTLGRHLYAIGGSRDTSQAVGIQVRRIVLGTFALNGLIVGLAGVLAASRLGSANAEIGVGYELNIITSVILGGVAFSGGEGNVLGVMLAVALLGIIDSGMVALGVDPHWTDIFKGGALILAVVLDQLTIEQQQRRRTRLAMKERE